MEHTHYMHGDIYQRFMENVSVFANGGCWIWKAAINSRGYGAMRFQGKQMRAHRLAYKLFRGEIPDGLIVRHDCDMPACVNPMHLCLGTNRDNTDDMLRRGRQNARLTEKDVHLIRNDTRTNSAIGLDYGVDRSHVCCIKNRRRWGHV